MAYINITLCGRGSESEFTGRMRQEILDFEKLLKPGIDLVVESCEALFPDLVVKYTPVNPEGIDHEMLEDEIWHAYGFCGLETHHPDGLPELNYQVGELDRWKEKGEPLYEDVVEYLFDADWSLIRPFLSEFSEDLGCSVWVEFSAIKAVHSYKNDGYHFYYNPYTLS